MKKLVVTSLVIVGLVAASWADFSFAVSPNPVTADNIYPERAQAAFNRFLPYIEGSTPDTVGGLNACTSYISSKYRYGLPGVNTDSLTKSMNERFDTEHVKVEVVFYFDTKTFQCVASSNGK